MKVLLVFQICLLMLSSAAFSQQKEAVRWLNFEQLEDSLQINPKKVFIAFYAEWCSPCLKMQREVFTDEKITELLNTEYYAVKMDVECTDTIYFGNETYINERQKRRNPIHQIPLLMASRNNKPFTLPALVFLDEKFQAKARYFKYLNVKQLTEILEKM